MADQYITSRDYWPDVLDLIDEDKELKSPNGKPLDEFLSKKLNLSRLTVYRLLLFWESQGKVIIKKDLLSRKIIKVRLNQTTEENRVLILVDLENLQVNMDKPLNSLISRIDNVRNQIANEVGKIINIVVFTPYHLASVYGKDLQSLGIFTIVCPKVPTEKNGDMDTTDETLIEFGKKQISQIPELTHLCIGSGDEHFSPLAKEAKEKGLKILIIAGNPRALSRRLIELAEKKPGGGRKVYLLSPAEK